VHDQFGKTRASLMRAKGVVLLFLRIVGLVTLLQAATDRPAAECVCRCSAREDYKPIQMTLDPIPELKLEEPQYPKSKFLFPPAIQEPVPVVDGRFRISEDVVVSAGDEFVASLGAGRTVSVQGALRYQACDTNKWLPPRGG
jgi:hypothetical protein